MPVGLEITFAPERLGEGTSEERACFGLFTVRVDEIDLTGGMDFFINSYRSGPLVSGYHAAEWFAWNWWRLCYEPRSTAPEWWRAHKMTAIGEGYVWPNVTIFSDGVRTTILSESSVRPDAKPMRYLGAPPRVMPSTQLEAAIDVFIPRILGRLREQGVGETNLDRVWNSVLSERGDPDRARRCRLEALLGHDPNEADPHVLEGLLTDAALLGEQAIDELAAHRAQGGALPSATDLRQAAEQSGYEIRPDDSVRLEGAPTKASQDVPAWKIGADAARALRAQIKVLEGPITDRSLTELGGVNNRALEDDKADQNLSFALEQSSTRGSIVLRSRWKTGRRFELARLLADRIVAPVSGPLHAATRAYTWRQKMQRSFAAEFLSPFEAVDAKLAGDYSAEAQADAAAHFQVSERTILTQLVNHQRLERDDLYDDLGNAA